MERLFLQCSGTCLNRLILRLLVFVPFGADEGCNIHFQLAGQRQGWFWDGTVLPYSDDVQRGDRLCFLVSASRIRPPVAKWFGIGSFKKRHLC